MKNEIDKDFYCSTAGMGDCPEWGNCLHGCPDCHRKYPTPEQFKQEYGGEYPFDGAVYGFNNGIGAWMIYDLFDAKRYSNIEPIVCACTPFGRPPDNWRPE